MATKPTGIPGLKVVADHLADLQATLLLLTEREVLVGFPEDTTARQEDLAATIKGKPQLGAEAEITNAALGYIHDKGMPEQNIPARPFMIPGMSDATPAAIKHLTWTAKQVLLRRGATAVLQGFERTGLAVQAAIRRKINEGIPPPLADATLRDRARKGRKGAKQELANRDAGLPPSTDLAKPLIDTGQLRNAVNYVIRRRTRRK